MKTLPFVVAALFVVLQFAYVPGAGAQERESSRTVGRPPPNVLRGDTPRQQVEQKPALKGGVGICLIGEKFVYTDDASDADECDAIIWVDAVRWLVNQRKLIDETMLAGEAQDSEGAPICRSCSGTCQTVALPIKDSTYTEVEAESGLRPDECLKRIREICEAGSFRHLNIARCGN